MREIKFRAWVEEPGTDIRWFFYFKIGETVSPSLSVVAWEQFTGLHDKNGKEIYEGDIDEARGICVWIEEDCRWAFQEVETGHQHGLFAITGNFNIIGNIHENPELLND